MKKLFLVAYVGIGDCPYHQDTARLGIFYAEDEDDAILQAAKVLGVGLEATGSLRQDFRVSPVGGFIHGWEMP